MLSKAFLKDAGERVLATFVAVFIGVIAADGFEWSTLGSAAFWAPVLITTAVTTAKALGLGIISPNTGASLGTAVPSGQVVAAVDVKTQDVVAGEGSTVPNGETVHVITDLPPTQ